nr:methyltransferase [bacterium]
MTSRTRLQMALEHRQPDRAPLDLSATMLTGMHAQTLYRLRRLMGLEDRPITIIEPFQMLGRVDEDLMQALGVDVIGLWNPSNMFGCRNEDYFDWKLADGTPVRMPGTMAMHQGEDGSHYVHPQGNKAYPASARMPKDGYFFDNIDRAPEFDEDDLDPVRDFKLDFQVIDDETARELERKSKELYENTQLGIVGLLGG